MSYLQVILLCIGMGFAIGFFGSNHYRMPSSGDTHYAWFHPRMLALAATALSTAWLVTWPLVAAYRTQTIRALIVTLGGGMLYAVIYRKLSVLQRLALGIFMVPLASLAVGGMPPEMSWTANLAILNIIPTLYLFHHKKDERLRDIIARHDIIAAYAIWIVGHVLAYWSLVAITFRVAGPSLLWVLLHGREIGRSSAALCVMAGLVFAWRALRRRFVKAREQEKTRPVDQQAPHFIIE